MYIVTTLGAGHPADEVASVYLHRWEIELRFRDIKTTMEMLRPHSPRMVENESFMHMIGHNLVKLLMLKAGGEFGVNHRRTSFKGVLQVTGKAVPAYGGAEHRPRVLARAKVSPIEDIARREVAERPGRNEVRKLKRRPKSYRWSQRPRHCYLEAYRNDEPPLNILDKAA